MGRSLCTILLFLIHDQWLKQCDAVVSPQCGASTGSCSAFGVTNTNECVNLMTCNSNLPTVPGAECKRPCTGGPRNCYFEFFIENYATYTGACQNCSFVPEDCFSPQCITADGFERSLKSVNRMMPGPDIQVCNGDTIIVEVHNMMFGESTAIHWHGMLHKGTQWMDGVPSVTQCEIQEGQSFRYVFTPRPGTHYWHSHTEYQKLDGITGALIVRECKCDDPSGDLYDYDLCEHYILIQDWMHVPAANAIPSTHPPEDGYDPRTFLINGYGRYLGPRDDACGEYNESPLAVFNVKKDRRYRFRVINAGSLSCPHQLVIQQHQMTIIAADGEPVKPLTVVYILTQPGERYDFVLDADQPPGIYWIMVVGTEECGEVPPYQLALLVYNGVDFQEPPLPNFNIPDGVSLNGAGAQCTGGDNFCTTDLRYAGTCYPDLGCRKPDVKLVIPIGLHFYQNEELFQEGKYIRYVQARSESRPYVAYMGRKLVFSRSSSPLLTQCEDIDPAILCDLENRPAICRDDDEPCFCTHIETVPLNAVVEILLINDFENIALLHPLHLHGYVFQVLEIGPANTTMEEDSSPCEDFVCIRNGCRPYKDTVILPARGFVRLRFLTDNPGFWLFHCHITPHLAVGMAMVIHVQGETPPPPCNFPQCGDFLPPICSRPGVIPFN